MVFKDISNLERQIQNLFHTNRTIVWPCDLKHAADCLQYCIPQVEFTERKAALLIHHLFFLFFSIQFSLKHIVHFWHYTISNVEINIYKLRACISPLFQ